MKGMSHHRRELVSKSRALRASLVRYVGKCELCGTSPEKPRHRFMDHNRLCCHEVLNGPLRQKVLGEPSCLIVACWRCNGDELNSKGDYPLVRQLAVIKARAPWRYDLRRVLELRNPNAMNYVTEDEVDEWIRRDSRSG